MKLVRSLVFASLCAAVPAAVLAQSSAGERTTPSQPSSQSAQQGAQQLPPDQKKQEQEQQPQKYTETVVVTASKVEEKLVNAPATMTVLTGQLIQSSPSQNFADLMRAVPGINVTQVSARDINLTSRGATATLATGELAILDGRSLYLDFFGFVMWDFLPVNFDEIKQIEVIRGPASAVWGANAMNGVVNVITKSPREIAGTSLTMGVGTFSRDTQGSGQGNGSIFYANGTFAAPVNSQWAYKLSGGAYTQDALPRPTGIVPGSTPPTPYPPYQNTGTTQPKFDARVDYDNPDGKQHWGFSGGVAGTDGIMHSGIGPFDIQSGSLLGYAKVDYRRRAFNVNFFTNILNGDASNLLAVDVTGQPVRFLFKTNTYDFEFGNAVTFAARHVVSYGGNFRYNKFDLSLAPGADSRTEGGFYAQDDMFLHDRARLVVGARIDGFSNLPDPVFSPRIAFMLKPAQEHTVRFSYNKAYRSPSVTNEYLDITILNQADLSTLPVPPVLKPLLQNVVFPIKAVGNLDVKEQSIDAWEVGYTGVIRNRTTLSAAYYYNILKDDINFTQTATYSSANKPITWDPRLPGVLLDLLNQAGHGLPSLFTYLNLGRYTQQGVELGFDTRVNRNLNAYVNYSYQHEPVPDNPADVGELNIPPKNRVNVGFNTNVGRFLGNLAISYNGSAFWQDVLDARYHGYTNSYTMVNLGGGVKFAQNKMTATVKIINLTNKDIQQHIFGDILKRQVIGEIKARF